MALASLMLAAIAVLSSPEARAGCHHPWIKGLAGSRIPTDLKILEDAGDVGGSHRDSPARPGPSPCARGACSPAPMIPVSSSQPTPQRVEFWGVLGCGLMPMQGAAPGAVADQACAATRHRTIPVERPPR